MINNEGPENVEDTPFLVSLQVRLFVIMVNFLNQTVGNGRSKDSARVKHSPLTLVTKVGFSDPRKLCCSLNIFSFI